MTPDELLAFLHQWLTAALPGVTVIQSHQNAPAPLGPYVTIDLEGAWDSFGFSSQGIPAPDAALPDQLDALSTKRADYTVTAALWQVDGDGSLLLQAVESLDTKDTAALFEGVLVSVLSVGELAALPRNEAEKWRKEYRVPISLHVVRTISDPTTYIESVEFINQIGG